MSYFYITSSYDDLEHHGILGQKWGVRRFRNYDGTYTKKGLERYRKSEEKYDAAKSKYKEAKKTKNGTEQAKLDYLSSKRQLKTDYKKLKKDYDIDKGRELYQKGKTVERNESQRNMALKAAGAIIAANTAITPKILQRSGKTYADSMKITAIADLATAAAGAAFVSKIEYENKKLRAWHFHSKDD